MKVGDKVRLLQDPPWALKCPVAGEIVEVGPPGVSNSYRVKLDVPVEKLTHVVRKEIDLVEST
jgi:hypothetical protein